MREGPLEILDRARDVFVKSLIDGIGKADAGAEFYLTAISAERSGYIISQRDESLIKMFNSVIRKEYTGGTTQIEEQDWAPQTHQKISEQQMGFEMDYDAGAGLPDSPSINSNRVVGVDPNNVKYSGRQFELNDGEADDPYRTHNPLSEGINPLHGQEAEVLGNFYLSDHYKNDPQSLIDAKKEADWEEHAKEADHNFLTENAHYGSLDTEHATNHALYLHDYQEWENRNRDMVERHRNLKQEEGLSEREIDHQLKTFHMNEKKKDWKENLGFMDYYLGLEFFTPEEREKVYRHLLDHGGSSSGNEPLKLGRHSNDPDLMPRLKRSWQQRFSGLYDWWTRHPQDPMHPTMTKPIPLSEDVEQIGRVHNMAALKDTDLGQTKSPWETAVDSFNKMYRAMVDPNHEGFMYTQVPYYEKGSDGQEKIYWRKQEQKAGTRKVGSETIQIIQQNHIGERLLRDMLGIDDNGQLVEDGQHPLWGPNWKNSDSPFTQDDIDKIMRRRRDEAVKTRAAGRAARNHAIFHYGSYVHPDHYDYTDDAETLATHWKKPFQVGGLGKNPNLLFDLLHHHSIMFNPKEDAAKEKEAQTIRDFYGDDFDTGEDEEEVDYEKVSRETALGGLRESSLMFDKTANEIRPVHTDLNTRSMEGFMGPFGQRQLSILRGPQGESVSFKGDFERLGSLLSPFNVTGTRRLSSQNAHDARHMSSVNGKFTNEEHDKFHTGRTTGDTAMATAAHDALRGETPNHLRVKHAHKGNFSDDDTASVISHSFHSLGTALGMANPPMAPASTVISHRDKGIGEEGRPSSTLSDHADLEDLASRYARKPEAFDKESEIERLEASFEQDRIRLVNEIAALDSKKPPAGASEEELEKFQNLLSFEKTNLMQELKELPAGKQRMLDRLENDTVLHQFNLTNENEEDIGMAGFSGREMNPVNVFSRQLSVTDRPDSPEQESDYYEGLISQIESLENEFPDLPPQLKPAKSEELEELRRKAKDWERKEKVEGKSGRSFGGKGHYNTLQSVLRSDTNAITEAGIKLKQDMMQTPEGQSLLAEIFNPNADFQTIAANMRMWAQMSNDYLHRAPSDAHDIHTAGNTDTDVTGRSVKTDDFSADLKNSVSSSGVSVPEDAIEDYFNQSFRINQILDSQPYQENPSKYEPFVKDAENKRIEFENSFMNSLGLDTSDDRLRQTMKDYIDNTVLPRLNEGKPIPPVMSGRQFISQKYPDIDIDAMLADLDNNKRRGKPDVKEFARKVEQIYAVLGRKGSDERSKQAGIGFQLAHNLDDRFDKDLHTERSSFGNSSKKDARFKDVKHKVMQTLNSLITSFPEVEAPQSTTETVRGLGRVKVGPTGHDTSTVHSIYNSGGFKHEFGHEMKPNFNYTLSSDGTPKITLTPDGNKQRLVPLLYSFWKDIAPPEWLDKLNSPEHQASREKLNEASKMGAQFVQDSVSYSRNQDPKATYKSEIGLADLTNPDIIRKDLGPKVPTLQPMHRIFELDDLEHLRGFTGDWMVSVMPEGERGFVKKDDDEVTSPTFDLSDDDEKNFKKVADENYHIDVIKTEEGYYIFDVLEFDDKEVHEVTIDDRIKILRGGMEGIENIHLPSASDTRLTDDAGLKLAVEDLQKEHESLLLRDAKSTYMAGELRHPKWVMLKPGKDVVLRVLERRGNGPYTYRLGTGPITQAESIGNRAVESGEETYMDVGVAFNSPDKYNEGDHVRVNAANVTKVESIQDEYVYTLTGSDIIGEAEGEGLVSRETLGLLAKSLDSQWLCEVHRAKSGIRVVMPQGDVVYKATESSGNWSLHSPLSSNNYLIRLSESQRVYWGPIAGALLKANLDIKEPEQEDKAEVHESKGDGKPLIAPKKIKETKWTVNQERDKVLVKGLLLIEKLLKSGVGSVGQSSTGAMGLGIDYATPIESPMGPTNLHDEKTMPDYDNKKRPGEDSSIEPETEDREDKKHLVIPVSEGVLEIDSDKAVFHT